MNVEELAQELRRMYDSAPDGEQNTAVLLFGIRYADHLLRGANRIAGIVQRSDLPRNWASEISKGRNLVRYVDLNGDATARYWP